MGGALIVAAAAPASANGHWWLQLVDQGRTKAAGLTDNGDKVTVCDSSRTRARA
jgi:hypothetical protein